MVYIVVYTDTQHHWNDDAQHTVPSPLGQQRKRYTIDDKFATLHSFPIWTSLLWFHRYSTHIQHFGCVRSDALVWAAVIVVAAAWILQFSLSLISCMPRLFHICLCLCIHCLHENMSTTEYDNMTAEPYHFGIEPFGIFRQRVIVLNARNHSQKLKMKRFVGSWKDDLIPKPKRFHHFYFIYNFGWRRS